MSRKATKDRIQFSLRLTKTLAEYIADQSIGIGISRNAFIINLIVADMPKKITVRNHRTKDDY